MKKNAGGYSYDTLLGHLLGTPIILQLCIVFILLYLIFMEGGVQISLENLHISGEIDGSTAVKEDDSGVNSSLQTPSKDTTYYDNPSTNNPILICDSWYGFPTQKRPRKERINAVSRQLSNFLQWRSSSSSTTLDSSVHNCKISLLGSDVDVKAVKDRIHEITNNNTDHKDVNGIDFQSNNITIHQYIDKLQLQDTADEDVVYLSPDASDTLSCTSPPPRIVIIGMLIDRRITTDRSRKRAEEVLKIRSAKLPLDELNVKELSNQEPLNVDTVLELMQRWHWNCEQLKKKHDEKITSDMYRNCFISAAAYAMKTQRDRHPNRTVHMTSKE